MAATPRGAGSVRDVAADLAGALDPPCEACGRTEATRSITRLEVYRGRVYAEPAYVDPTGGGAAPATPPPCLVCMRRPGVPGGAPHVVIFEMPDGPQRGPPSGPLLGTERDALGDD